MTSSQASSLANRPRREDDCKEEENDHSRDYRFLSHLQR